MEKINESHKELIRKVLLEIKCENCKFYPSIKSGIGYCTKLTKGVLNNRQFLWPDIDFGCKYFEGKE